MMPTMQLTTAGKTAVKKDPKDWEKTLSEFNKLCHTFINLYDPKSDRFVFVNTCFAQLPIDQPVEILGKGLDSWLKNIHKDDIKKTVTHFLESGIAVGKINQNAQNRLFYRILNSNNKIAHILHEQKFIKAEHLYILNILTDITEKETVKTLANELNNDLNPNDFENPLVHPKESPDDISHREHEVLQLIATGLSSKEIADKLYISNHTAISHRKNLIEKFNVKNTAELIKEASKVLWFY